MPQIPQAPLPRPPRRFFTKDVLEGRVSLEGYPFRYIVLSPRSGLTLSGVDFIHDEMLTTIELLESRGWELVTLEEGGMLAFLRRVHPPVRRS